jgi:hypothetical protein
VAPNGIMLIPNFVKIVSPDLEVEKRDTSYKPHLNDSNLKHSYISEGLLILSSGSSTPACLAVQIHPSSLRNQIKSKRSASRSCRSIPRRRVPVPSGQETGWGPEPFWMWLFSLLLNDAVRIDTIQLRMWSSYWDENCQGSECGKICLWRDSNPSRTAQ